MLETVIAATAAAGAGLMIWRFRARRRLTALWQQAGDSLGLRFVSRSRGVVMLLAGEVRGAPVAARLIPESTRNAVTIFVGPRATAICDGSQLEEPSNKPTALTVRGLRATIDEHGFTGERPHPPEEAEHVVRWVQASVAAYLNAEQSR